MSLLRAVGRRLQRLGSWISRDSLEAGWVTSGGNNPFGTAKKASTRAWLEAAETAGRLRSGVDRYGKDIACFTWRLYRKSGTAQKDLVEVHQHPILDWMRHPWRSLGGGSWWSLAYLLGAYLQIDGNNWWFMPFSPQEAKANNVPFEVWPIPPQWVHTLPRPGFPMFGLCCGPQQEIPEWVPASRMVWIRKPSLLNPFGRGRGPVSSIDDEVVFGETANKYLNQFFRSSARPDMVIFAKGASPTDADRLERQFEARHSGWQRSFRPAILPLDGKLESVGNSFADMTLVELLRYNRDQQWQALGLSADIMGANENSNRATVEAADYQHSQRNLLPEATFLEQELNLWLIPLWGEPDLVLKCDNPVRETQEFILNKTVQGYSTGLLTRDEGRAALGFDPVGGAAGAMFGQPVNTIHVDQAGNAKPWPKAAEDTVNAPKRQEEL